MPEEPIVLAVQARDQATAIFARIDSVLKGLGQRFNATKKAEQDTEQAASGMARATPIIAGVGIAGAAAAIGVGLIAKTSIDAAIEYQSSTADLAASAAISIQQANAIGDAFLATAGKTVFSAQQQMAALAPLTGEIQLVTGHAINAADATKIMAASMDLAEASGTDLGAATRDVVNVMKVYHLSTSQASEASNMLYETARLTGQSVDAVAQSVDRLEGRLGPLGPSLSDVSTLMVELNKHGVEGRMAMMAATQGMNTLLSGSKSSAKAISDLGLTVFDANGKFVGMRDIIAQLQPKLAGMTEQQRLAAERMLFGATAGRELDAVILAGTKGYDSISAVINKHNAAADAAATRAKTFANEQRQLNATIDDAKVSLGEQLLPVVQQFMQAIMPVVTQIAQWINHNRQLTAGILIAVGVVGALVAISAALALVVAALSSPIILVIAGIALLAAGVIYAYTHVKWFHDAVNAVGGFLKTVFIAILHQFQSSWQTTFNVLGTVWGKIQEGWNLLQRFGAWLQRTFGPIIRGISDALGKVGGAVGAIGGALHAAHIPGFQAGGVVTGSEPVLAVLHPPEAVIPLAGTAMMSTGAVGGGVGGASIYFDLRGLTTYSEHGMNELLDAIGARVVRQILPHAGITIRR